MKKHGNVKSLFIEDTSIIDVVVVVCASHKNISPYFSGEAIVTQSFHVECNSKLSSSCLATILAEGRLGNGNLLQKGSFSEISKKEKRKEDGNHQHLSESNLKRLVTVTMEFDNCQTTLPSGEARVTQSIHVECNSKLSSSCLATILAGGHLRNGNLLRKKGSFSQISKKEKRKEDGNRQHLSESNLKRLVTVTAEFDNCQTTLPRY
ncbi:hypothetical protein CDAR_179151 [Caerostris darwini]|uniref:Uncharacterized protein n=1 Tax=Caerostris darwini TaxID=1538125 RepID=A0AAV4PFI1_9ARAC|nr:hypothetical protein CDAR_179151 [Caerostris darwini]